MTREEKLWTMTGKTLLGIAEGMGLDVNKNILKQGKEKLIVKILEAEKKLENGANNEQMEVSEELTEEVSEEITEETPAETEEEPIEEAPEASKKTSKKAPKKANLKMNELTYKGETKSIRAWADQINMPWATLYDRVNRNRWSVEDAIEIPLGQRRR